MSKAKELEEAKKWITERVTYIAENCDLNNKNNKRAYDSLSAALNYIDNSISKEVVKEKLMKYFDINTNNCMAYNLTRVKEARQYGTLTIDDFVEFDEDTINDIVNYIFNK